MSPHKVAESSLTIASAVVSSDYDGSVYLLELPEDVLTQLSASLAPADLCNLSLTCKKLHALCGSDKIWWVQCKTVLANHSVDLQAWRSCMPSYKLIFRFIQAVKPLLGIWVHQNPELGNMVYVTWGFLSVIGCRIIPQELGPRGLDAGLLWAPVFEIIGNSDGGLIFFLHGREKDKDFCYPGCVNAATVDCNVLLLEAEPRRRTGSIPGRASCAIAVEADNGESSSGDDFRRLSKAGSRAPKLKKNAEADPVPFHRLHFADRRKLLDAVASHVRVEIPKFAMDPLFLPSNERSNGDSGFRLTKAEWHNQMLRMSERRSLLIWVNEHGDPDEKQCFNVAHNDGIDSGILLERMCPHTESQETPVVKPASEGESSKGRTNTMLEKAPRPPPSVLNGTMQSDILDLAKPDIPRKRSLAKTIREKMKQIIRMGQGQESGILPASAGGTAMKRLLLQQFLKQSDSVALRLHATCWNLSRYRAWPLMHDNRFALYKMPEQKPGEGREHAGLWGGTFGWPPGKPAVEDKPGKALYFLLLSYASSEEGRLLTATKILEGTHYVLHPNGSPMFTVKVDEPSSECFPWHADHDGAPFDIVEAYQGEGIANGYGFRYPGSRPGDLFVERKGFLAFVWRESQVVLTLQKLDLQWLLENGKRVAALPPIANFVYLTKSYSNVFAGYCGLGIRSRAPEVPSQ